MKSVELFAGAGGLGMGVTLAGFHPAEVVERDPNCCASLRANGARGLASVMNWPISECDVRQLDFSRHCGRVELITGGPPCQPFSIGGRHRAHSDARDMFPEAVRALREIKPRAFIFENVKGLTRQTFSNYFEYIRLQMIHPEIIARQDEDWSSHLARLEQQETCGRQHGLKYNVVVHLANAADYGVPQKRERVFFVGFRSDLEISWHFPKPTHSAEALAWMQYRDGAYWDTHLVPWRQRNLSEPLRARAWKISEKPSTQPWRTIREALVGLPDCERDLRKSAMVLNHRFQPGARSYIGHTGSPLDEPAKTLKAGVHGVPGGENMLLKPDGSVRYFSVRESARLQTFPDDFVFQGSWSECMRQLGNAVPVNLARIIAEDVKCHLEKKFDQGSLQSPRQNKSARSIESELRTRAVSSLGEDHEIIGAGVYAIYYAGDFPAYAPIAGLNRESWEQPIYVGKAIPKGGRKGGILHDAAVGTALSSRLKKHSKSISATENLQLKDFVFRCVVLDDIWIPLGENVLIETFKPLWNVAVEGFGINDPGSGRTQQKRSPWDILHPGRTYAARLTGGGAELSTIVGRVEDHFARRTLRPLPRALAVIAREAEEEDSGEI